MSEKRLFSSPEALHAAYPDTDNMLDHCGEVPMDALTDVLTVSKEYQQSLAQGLYAPASFAFSVIEKKLHRHDSHLFSDDEEFLLYDHMDQLIGGMTLKTNYNIDRQEVALVVPNLIYDPTTVRSELILIHDAPDKTYGSFNGNILDMESNSTDTEKLCDTLASLTHTKLVVNK